MGRCAPEDQPGHEGYMQRELTHQPSEREYMAHHDETAGTWWCSGWASGLPEPTGHWRAACECGWRGDIADPDAIRAIDPDHDPVSDMLDETVEDLLLAAWEVHLNTNRPLSVLRDAALAAVTTRDALDDAVSSARSAGHSWGDIANKIGVTRQAAHARWATKTNQ